MSEPAGDGPVIGIVGDDDDVTDALAAAGARTVTGRPADVLAADPAAVVAVEEPALLAVAGTNPSVPLLAVDSGPGVRSVPHSKIDAVADRLVGGDWQTEPHPLVSVDATGQSRQFALLDVMLVTADPADISEYTVTAGGERVAQFRADGVVAATPAGTSGYARAAGGPVVPPGSDQLVVVPIAPFATTLDHWVVPLDDVRITVERDEALVEVLVDDWTAGTVGVDDTVRLDCAGHAEFIRVPEGMSPFDPGGAELEKL